MKVTECLGIEHRIFLRQLERVEQAQRQGTPDAERRAMVALLGAALEEHADIEDQLLFPALEPYLDRQAGPLAVMAEEHEEIRRLLGQAADPAADITPVVKRFIHTARHHFAKEDQVLFPMVEKLLGQERLEELGRACPHVQPQPSAR